jgi:hypothetical protein
VRTIGTADRVRRAMTNRLKPEIVVGFDSEWVDASHADEGIPPNALNLTLDARLRIGFSRLYARVEKGALDCPAPSDHRFRFRQSIPKHQYSINELEGLTLELNALQEFLKSETDRVQREVESALAGIRIIIETISP